VGIGEKPNALTEKYKPSPFFREKYTSVASLLVKKQELEERHAEFSNLIYKRLQDKQLSKA